MFKHIYQKQYNFAIGVIVFLYSTAAPTAASKY